MDFSNKKILIISPETWDHIPVSKHHYSIELATSGAKVFFLNPPSDIRQSEIVLLNLTVIDYKTIRGINKLPSFLRDIFNNYLIKKIRKIANSSFDVIWSFDPNRFQNLNLFNAERTIYHAVDVHSAPLEHEIAGTADILLSVSDLILDKFSALNKSRVKVNHGLRSHFLEQKKPIITGKIEAVGYVGNLDNHCIDIKTLIEIVEENKGIKFHFIGPYRQGSVLAGRLKKINNCILIGRVETDKLPEIFSGMNAFLMCYDGDSKTVNSNHHKILEFLSTGKPTIINYTDEYKNHPNVVIMSETNKQLPTLFKQVVNYSNTYLTTELIDKRMDFARSNSYKVHIDKIFELIYR
jgi:hypothetical protein